MTPIIDDIKKTVSDLSSLVVKLVQRGPVNYKIQAIEYYLPEKILTNEYLSRECGIDSDFLEKKVGISERHVAAPEESPSDMAVAAAEKLIGLRKINRGDIGLLMICTQNPDYRLPTMACIVQHRLKLSAACLAFDINLGCSGFVYGLSIAGNFIKTGAVQKALMVMVDQYSKIIDYSDKNTAALFGDAASAILLAPADHGFGVIDQSFGTDGSGAENLILYNSGVVKNPEKNGYLYMNGRKIIEFSMSAVPASVKGLLKKNKLTIKDIKHFIFHQANEYMLRKIQKHLSIPDEKMVIDVKDYGNTVSSTIPIALKNLHKRSPLQKGDLLVFVGFGVGYSWGSVLYKHVD
jgi:3-oxoacyl-[acyl-carrier-protein] synthase III